MLFIPIIKVMARINYVKAPGTPRWIAIVGLTTYLSWTIVNIIFSVYLISSGHVMYDENLTGMGYVVVAAVISSVATIAAISLSLGIPFNMGNFRVAKGEWCCISRLI